jgi:hypothetical protein
VAFPGPIRQFFSVLLWAGSQVLMAFIRKFCSTVPAPFRFFGIRLWLAARQIRD